MEKKFLRQRYKLSKYSYSRNIVLTGERYFRNEQKNLQLFNNKWDLEKC